jgi:hypothetical protein
MKLNKMIFLSRFRARSLDDLSAMLSVKSSKPLIQPLIIMTEIVVGSVNRNWVRLILLYLKRVRQLYKHQGLPGAVKYLKASMVVTQQVIAGHHTHDITPLGPRISRSKGGLPRLFPVEVRKRISSGDHRVLKWVLTMLSLFRVMIYDSEPKFSTITKNSTAVISKLTYYSKLVPKILRSLVQNFDFKLPEPKQIDILSASSNSIGSLGEFSTFPDAVIRSLSTLPKFVKVWDSVLWFANTFPSKLNKLIYYAYVLSEPSNYNVPSKEAKYLPSKGWVSHNEWKAPDNKIGKIGLKQEPAGKVRIFAMADPITQWLLRPLHVQIFKFLKTLKTDGTFNQLAPLKRVPFDKGIPLYSLDLSAATDRLPIDIQVRILEVLFGTEYSLRWKSILIDRPYVVNHGEGLKESLFYNTGQPMGSLSSWAMLALTHHVIVQMAAYLSCIKLPFTRYAVLGDDIIIWSKPVQRKYLEIMDNLGVEINLTKSIVSETGVGLEFAKKTIIHGINVSPFTLQEYMASLSNSSALLELKRKYDLPLSIIKKIIGLGYKSSTSSLRFKILTILLHMPTNLEAFRELLINKFLKGSTRLAQRETLSLIRDTWFKILVSLIEQIEADISKSEVYLNNKEQPSTDFHSYMRNEIEEFRVPKVIEAREELISLLITAKNLKPMLNRFARFANSELLGSRMRDISPSFLDELRNLLTIFFKVEDSYSKLQIQQLIAPTPIASSSPDSKEKGRLQKMWNR